MAQQLANELKISIETDRTVLQSLALVLSSYEQLDSETVLSIINAFDITSSYLSYLSLLTPDNNLLHQNGSRLDVSNQLDFAEEAQKGFEISDEMPDFFHPEDIVIRHAVPVRKDGQTIAILYGISSLSQLSEEYKTNIFEGNAYAYLINGDNGNFLIDTWHKSLGNLYEYGQRKTLPGFDIETMRAEISEGKSGSIAFISKTIEIPLYIYYAPIGINNWSIMISVDKNSAFQSARDIYTALIKMAVAEGIILLLYMAAIVIILLDNYRTIKRIGSEDPITVTLNRIAYQERAKANENKTFESLVCIYLDCNGLHELNNRLGHDAGDKMLFTIGKELKKAFSFGSVYRVGGDEFLVISEVLSAEECQKRVLSAVQQIEEAGYSISFGLISRKNEIGLDEITKEADSEMLRNKTIYYKTHNRRKRED